MRILKVILEMQPGEPKILMASVDADHFGAV